ncbi:MAG TPA: hypothetical protein DGB32_01780 [Dehalococcoidia bacterium]|jgi:hypothetical protein|nr:hypothetical protein [Chloroflexota bacterium]HCV27032.1 hypothetical protein [Dehalococcoidia bacterium]|tara:strand:+ start:97 stop:1683 length:1587 start_codon:yes stop_codon:yes gene_type:complete
MATFTGISGPLNARLTALIYEKRKYSKRPFYQLFAHPSFAKLTTRNYTDAHPKSRSAINDISEAPLAQSETAGKPRNALRTFWDDTLDPRRRSLVGLGVIALMLLGLISSGFANLTISGAGMSVYIALVVTLILARRGYYADRVSVFIDRDGERVETRQKLRPVLKRDRIQPLYEPSIMTAEEAIKAYPPNTRVIGIVNGGDVRAYPLAVLSYREIVHDVIGGAAIALTWSPFCYTARAFLVPSDAPVRFGSTGRVAINAPVMYDVDTGVRWIQYLGAPLEGPDIGSRLDEIPSLNTTLQAWIDAHPNTEVLDDPVAPRADMFDRYYAGGRAGMHGVPHRDARWPAKEIVGGVDTNGDACAFPMSWLQIEPVVNETVGGTPLVVAYEEHSASVMAFRAETAGGRSLTFEPGVWEEPEDDEDDLYHADVDSEELAFDDDEDREEEEEPEYEPMMLYDAETGSRWQATSGTCIEGELVGEQLQPVAAGLSFWFAWTNFHPSTRLPPRPDLSGLAPKTEEPGESQGGEDED